VNIGIWAQPAFFPATPPAPRDFEAVTETGEEVEPQRENRYRFHNGIVGDWIEIENVSESSEYNDELFDRLEALRQADRNAWSATLDELDSDTYRQYMIDRTSRWHMEKARPALKCEREGLEAAVKAMRDCTRAEAYDRKGQSMKLAQSIRERATQAKSLDDLCKLADEADAFDNRTQQLVSVKALLPKYIPDTIWNYIEGAIERAHERIKAEKNRHIRSCPPEVDAWIRANGSKVVEYRGVQRPMRILPRHVQVNVATQEIRR